MGEQPYIDANKNDKQHSLSVVFFKKVAQISLWVTAISVITLAVLIFSMEAPTGSYRSMLQSLANSKDNLPFILFVAGLWLIGATATTTYFITLYSSFRLAGPLFRFARNLEFGHQHELPMPLIKIRTYDYFQQECALMDESIEAFISHYQTLSVEVEQLAMLPMATEADKLIIIEKIEQIKTIEARLTR